MTVGSDVVLGAGVVWDVARGGRVEIGAGAAIGERCRFHVAATGVVRIGAGAVLADGCVLRVQTAVTIGDGARLADGVAILDHAPAHDAPHAPELAPSDRAAGPVAIGAGARIGPYTVLEPGVTVPANDQVGANLVVSPPISSHLSPAQRD